MKLRRHCKYNFALSVVAVVCLYASNAPPKATEIRWHCPELSLDMLTELDFIRHN